MKSKRTIAIAASMLIATVLTGCANLQTVERTTPIEDDTAIHLDAQQRLVLFTRKKFTRENNTDEQKKTDKEKYYTKYTYCAEPSPDAMSSYAASLALGLSGPSQSDAFLVNALQSPTGNIGLRTQSITLMRDALYRMCEAYNNGGLDEGQVNELFRRSQNLTAVVLAVEQLTGAVSPNSILLTPNVRASASLLLNQQLLDQAKYRVQNLQKGVTAAENELKKIPNSAQAGEETTKKAENNLKYAKERLKDAIEVRDAIQASRNAALTNATAETAETQSSEQFSIPGQHHLNAETAKEIATAVKDMVTNVINENDAFALCLSGKNHKDCKAIFESHVKIKELHEQTDKLREQIKASVDQTKKLGEQAEKLVEQTKASDDQTKELSKQADRLRDQTKASDDQTKELSKQADRLREQTKASDEQMKELGKQTDRLREQTKASVDQTKKLGEQAEKLVEQTKELRQRVEASCQQVEESCQQAEGSDEQTGSRKPENDKTKETKTPDGGQDKGDGGNDLQSSDAD